MERKGVLFVAGVAVGSFCGLVVGSLVAARLGPSVRKLTSNLVNKLLHQEESVKFEYLLQ